MKNTHRWIGFACAVSAAVVVTLAGQLMVPRFDIVNIAMVYLLAVVLIAVCFSRGAAILSAVLCVAAFDFTFVPPQGAFTINDIQYLLTFAIMLTVAVVISVLMEHRRRHDQQRAELELQADTERIRSTLLASISHDLRTPLAAFANIRNNGLIAFDIEEGDELAARRLQAKIARTARPEIAAGGDGARRQHQVTHARAGQTRGLRVVGGCNERQQQGAEDQRGLEIGTDRREGPECRDTGQDHGAGPQGIMPHGAVEGFRQAATAQRIIARQYRHGERGIARSHQQADDGGGTRPGTDCHRERGT